MWPEEGSRPGFRRPSSPGFIPPATPASQSGVQALSSLPLQLDEPRSRAASNIDKVLSAEAIADTVSMTEAEDAALREARKKAGGNRLFGVIGGLLFLGGGGFLAWHFQPWRANTAVNPPSLTRPRTAKSERPNSGTQGTTVEPKEPENPPEEPEKMSPAEIQRMLEWARRTVEGGRIVAPPGDNLKELLDRIDHADPGNADAVTLRKQTANTLARKGSLAMRKGRVDEAVQTYQDLAALNSDDADAQKALERALRVRAARLLERRKPQAAMTDATAALEIDADDAAARLILADSYLALGKPELSAEEYQRVLEARPADKRAKRGLILAQAAKAPKPPPKGGKKKKLR
jgi:tetratricopeptide (TPR) repeat protein